MCFYFFFYSDPLAYPLVLLFFYFHYLLLSLSVFCVTMLLSYLPSIILYRPSTPLWLPSSSLASKYFNAFRRISITAIAAQEKTKQILITQFICNCKLNSEIVISNQFCELIYFGSVVSCISGLTFTVLSFFSRFLNCVPFLQCLFE